MFGGFLGGGFTPYRGRVLTLFRLGFVTSVLGELEMSFEIAYLVLTALFISGIQNLHFA